MTRFEDLHSPARVKLAERLALMALEAEETTGKPVIYKDAWTIAHEIGVSEVSIRNALRLAYTGEFNELYGWSFVSPGSGRDGKVYGYALQHNRSTAASEEVHDLLDYTDDWCLDHLRGLRSHWERLALAHGRNTRIGRAAQKKADVVKGAEVAIESIIDAEAVSA